jgi:hypothetical protein
MKSNLFTLPAHEFTKNTSSIFLGLWIRFRFAFLKILTIFLFLTTLFFFFGKNVLSSSEAEVFLPLLKIYDEKTLSFYSSNMLITAYTPDSGDGISGSGTMASGKLPYVGAAACPIRMKFGTRVQLTGRAKLRASALRIPYELKCEDRFQNVYREGIDIAIPKNFQNLSDLERIELAKVFGLFRSSQVIVYLLP